MSHSSWFICSQFSLSVATLHEICLRLFAYLEQLQPGDTILSCFSDLIHTEWIRCQGKSCAKLRGLLTSMQKTQQHPGEQRGKRGGDGQEDGREGENEWERQTAGERGREWWTRLKKKKKSLVRSPKAKWDRFNLLNKISLCADYIMTGDVWLHSRKPDRWAPLHPSVRPLTSAQIHRAIATAGSLLRQHMCDTEKEPKMAEGAGLVSESQASPSASSPEMTELTQGEGEGYSGPALTLNTSTSVLHRPFCLLLVLILLILSFLGSWAVVHLSLGARGEPFRISSSYDQPGELETATYDPLFITNCTMGKKAGLNL